MSIGYSGLIRGATALRAEARRMHDRANAMEREADAMEQEARDGGVWCARCGKLPCGRFYHCLHNLGPT